MSGLGQLDKSFGLTIEKRRAGTVMMVMIIIKDADSERLFGAKMLKRRTLLVEMS